MIDDNESSEKINLCIIIWGDGNYTESLFGDEKWKEEKTWIVSTYHQQGTNILITRGKKNHTPVLSLLY